MWLGHVFGCGRRSLAEVKGERFPALSVPGKTVQTVPVSGSGLVPAPRLFPSDYQDYGPKRCVHVLAIARKTVRRPLKPLLTWPLSFFGAGGVPPRTPFIPLKASRIKDQPVTASRGSSQKDVLSVNVSAFRTQIIISPPLDHLSKPDFRHHLILLVFISLHPWEFLVSSSVIVIVKICVSSF